MIVFVPIFFSITLKTIDCLKGEKVKASMQHLRIGKISRLMKL